MTDAPMLNGESRKHNSARESARPPSASGIIRDIIAIVTITLVLAALLVFYDRSQFGDEALHGAPHHNLVPALLLWVAVSFGWFVYRRWREALRETEQAREALNKHRHREKGLLKRIVQRVGRGQGEVQSSWSWNLVSNKIDWSDEALQMLGMVDGASVDTYAGFLKLVHPEDRPLVGEVVARSLREKKAYEIDLRIVPADGEVRVIHQQGEPDFVDGKPFNMSGFIADVTERQREERELRSRFGLLRQLIEAIPIPVFHKDRDGVFIGSNKAFEDFFGLSHGDILGRDVFDISSHELAVISDNADKALFRQGGTQTHETIAIDGDGNTHNVIFHKAALSNDDGTSSGLIGTMLDITERKHMESALKESEQRFRNIAESASDWFWETDKDHRFSYLSDRIREIVGPLPESILGRNRLQMVGEDQMCADPEKWRHHKEDIENHRPFRDLDYQIIAYDGTMRTIKISGVPVFGEDKVFRGYRGTGSDITEHKRIEQALRESEERHRDFAADVAHELRTPLAVLRTHLDNLDDSHEANSLRNDVDGMSRMVTQLLTATRIEAYATAETFSDTDLCDVCRYIATLLAPIAIREHRSIEVTGSDVPVIVYGNRESLEQAVRNLVENAIRYSARETVISLDVEDGDAPAIRVIDRGKGVDPEMRQKIFRRFQRADRRGGGAGLGLSIVRRTVENHDAEILLEDTPGGGATFIIRFPKQD
ncbi:MAG: PAS domain S-box protein [Alphaproteobacteria bacterium]